MANLTAINEELSKAIAQMTRLQRAVEKEIEAEQTPAMVSLPADEVEELRAKAAGKPAPASSTASTTTKASAEEAKK